MRTLQVMMDQQRRWAEAHDLSADPKGYVPLVDDNLFRPLSPDALSEFRAGAGDELSDKPGEAAKMRALHSSAALVCNVFDHWRGIDVAVIGQVLDLPDPITGVRFEAQLPSGLSGTPATLDVLLTARDGGAWGVESKFTEPFNHTPSGSPFAESYFKSTAGRWEGTRSAPVPSARRGAA